MSLHSLRGHRTLYEFSEYLDWLPEIDLEEDELRRIPVHDSLPPSGETFLSLGNLPPGAPAADPSFARPVGTRQLYSYRRDVPPELWAKLENRLHRPHPVSGRPKRSMFDGLDVSIRDEEAA